MKANRPRSATNTLEKLNRLYSSWFAEPLSAITIECIESWKIRRLNTGCAATTVLRDMFTLSSVLSRAVRLDKLTDNPIRRVDKPRIDLRPKVRYLDEQEKSRLRAALHARDAEMRDARGDGDEEATVAFMSPPSAAAVPRTSHNFSSGRPNRNEFSAGPATC